MSETWTEYAVHWKDDEPLVNWGRTRPPKSVFKHGTVVGRTVTASDWLPVDTDGAK